MNKEINFNKFKKLISRIKKVFKGRDKINLSNIDERVSLKLKGLGAEEIAKKIKPKSKKKIIYAVSIATSIIAITALSFFLPTMRNPLISQDPLTKLAIQPPTPTITITPDKYAKSGYLATENNFTLKTKKPFANDVNNFIEIKPEIDYKTEQTNSKEIKIIPKEKLKAGKVYTINLKKGVQFENHSETTKDYTWKFKAEPKFTIKGITPREEANSVPIDTSIEFEFNHKNISATNFKKHFSITPSVPGKFEQHGMKIVFLPKNMLKTHTIYTIKVDKDFANNEGEKLSENHSATFITSDSTTSGDRKTEKIDIYWKSETQEVNVTERVYDEIGIYNNSDKNVKFTLYQINEEALLENMLNFNNFYRLPENAKKINSQTSNFNKRIATYSYTPKSKGIYLLEAEYDNNKIYKVHIYSSINIIASISNIQAEGWIWEMNQDIALSDITIQNYSYEKGEIIERNSTKTSKQGYFKIDKPDVLMVKYKDNYAFLNQDSHYIEDTNYNTGINNEYFYYTMGYKNEKYIAYINTNKPRYIKGETIKFSTIIKEIKGKQLITPSSKIKIRVEADNEYSETFNVDPNYGVISSEFLVPLNYDGYGISLNIFIEDKEINSKFIEIRETNKSKYQLGITSQKDRYMNGEKVSFDLEAINYSNQPASNEPFEIKLYKSTYKNTGKNYETIADHIYVPNDSPVIEEKKIKLNEEGKYTYKFEPKLDSSDEQFTAYKLEFFSKDEKAFASHYIMVANSKTDIQVTDTKEDTYIVGENGTIRLSAHKIWNQEPSANSKVKVIIKRDWYKKVQTGTRYDEELKENVPKYDDKIQTETFYENTVQVNKTKNINLTNFKKGDYYINLEWPGSKKTKAYRFYVRESTPEVTFRNYLTTKSTKSINAGETIKTNLKSIIDGKGIIFIKSGDIYEWKTFELKANQEKSFSFNTDHSIFPKAKVCAFITNDRDPKNSYDTFHKTGRYITSSCDITEVKSDQFYLNIDISSSKEFYKPGETTTLNLKVTDQNGHPVKSGLNIKITNQALLDSVSAREINTETLAKSLHNEKANISTLRSSIPSINWEAGGAGATGGGGGEPIRINFTDSAYWKGLVETDEQGKAQIKVKLPDNLTTWNIETIATSKKAQFGITNNRIKTQLDQALEMNLPKFVRINDTIQPEIKIKNWSDKLEGKIIIECSGCKEKINSQNITVENKSNKLIKPTIDISPQASKLTLTAKLYDKSGENLIDGVEKTIPIYSNSKITEEVKSSIITNEEKITTQTFDLGTEIRPDVTKIELTLSQAFAIDEFQKPLDIYTTSTNDISNSILHNSFIYQYHDILKPNVTKKQTEENLLLSYQKLINNQADNGGFSWFDYDAVSLESSVIAAQAIKQLTTNKIIEQDIPVEKSLESYFLTILHSSEYSTSEYVLAALGYSYIEPEATILYLPELEKAIDYENTLTLASLMQAYNNIGSTGKTAELATYLEETVVETKRGAYWIDKDSKFKTLKKSDYVTAMVYLAISPIEEWELKRKTRNWLIDRTYKNFDETNKSHQINYALAVSDVDNLYGYKEKEEITVYVNGKKLKTVTLDKSDDFYNKIHLDIGSQKLNKNKNEIKIESSGNSDIYALTKAYKFTPLNEIKLNENPDFKVGINYFDIDGNKLNNEEVTNMPANKYIKGQVTVKSAKEYQNLVIRTQLPAGLEPVGIYEDDISADTLNNYIKSWNVYTNRWGQVDTDYITFNSSSIKKNKEYKYEFLTLTRFEGVFNSGSSEAHIEFFPDIEDTVINPIVKIK